MMFSSQKNPEIWYWWM